MTLRRGQCANKALLRVMVSEALSLPKGEVEP